MGAGGFRFQVWGFEGSSRHEGESGELKMRG